MDGNSFQSPQTRSRIETHKAEFATTKNRLIDVNRPVPNDEARKSLLGADCFLRLQIGKQPDGSPFERIQANWPEVAGMS